MGGKQDYIVKMNRLDSVQALQDMFLSKREIEHINNWKEVKVPKPETLSDFQALEQKRELDIDDFYEVLTDAILKNDDERIRVITGEIGKNFGKFVDAQKVTRKILDGIPEGRAFNLKEEDLVWFTDRLSQLINNTSLKNRIKPLKEFEPPQVGTKLQLYLTDLYTVAYWGKYGEEDDIQAAYGVVSGGLAKTINITRHKDLRAIVFDEIIGNKKEIAESRLNLFKRFDKKSIAIHSTSFSAGLAILAAGEAGVLKGLQELSTKYGLYVASFGENLSYKYPTFHYNNKAEKPFPYIKIEGIEPFLVFDGDLLKERKTILQHGYKMIDGKVLTSDEAVIGMWWSPAFRPYLVEWFNQMDEKTRESILGSKTPEQFLFME